MKLLTKKLAKTIPALYETEAIKRKDKVARVKLFHSMSNWTWYIIEYDGQDQCFGYVDGLVGEYGYFSLAEIAAIGKDGTTLPVERDLYFEPTRMAELLR